MICQTLTTNLRWNALQQQMNSRGRLTCLFSDNRKQEQAKKALESALQDRKSDFEKWNKEIERKQELGGGGSSGRGGWFGGGGWSNWFNNEHFWEEAQQALLTVLGIFLLCLILAKGGVMFAVISNCLLIALRGTRNWLSFISSLITGKTYPTIPAAEIASPSPTSAKESVKNKWGAD